MSGSECGTAVVLRRVAASERVSEDALIESEQIWQACPEQVRVCAVACESVECDMDTEASRSRLSVAVGVRAIKSA